MWEHVCPCTHTHTRHEPTEHRLAHPWGFELKESHQAILSSLPPPTRPTVGPGAGWRGRAPLSSPWVPPRPSITSRELLPVLPGGNPQS